MSRTASRAFLLLGILLATTTAWAATQNAVVYGTVYDASGQPMPGVTVLLQNAALGFSRSTTTGSDGSYNFAEIPPADDYRLTASKAGRALDIRGGVSVNVGDERVILPPLTEQVVAADAPVEVRTVSARDVGAETASTAISGVITGDQLRSLPLYNRNFLALGLLTPNVRNTEAGSELAGASFSIAGTRPSTNNFLLDGADNVASSSNQAIPFQVNDAVQEFRVVSSTASAEYGRGQGGVVNIVTRRGGNAFHGSAFGYFASDAFNADSPLSVYHGTTFDQAAGRAGSTTAPALTIAPRAPLTYNEFVATAEAFGFCTDSLSFFTGVAGSVPCLFGGTGENTRFDAAAIWAANDRFDRPFSSQQFGVNAGGALVKDKLFGFASYEGTRIDNPNPVFERVPTTWDRTYDPTAIGTFAFGPTDPNYVLAQDALNLFPAPNVVGVPEVLEFFRGEAPNYTNVHNLILRGDYQQSENDSWAVRYVGQKLDQLHDATLPPNTNYPGNGAFRDALNQNLTISYSRTFSPAVINELRAGLNRFNVEEKAQDRLFDATSIGDPGFNIPFAELPTILLTGIDPQNSEAFPGANGPAPSWSEAGGTFVMRPTLDYQFPFARLGAPLTAPSERRDTSLFFADNLSVSIGKHSLKMGGEFRYLRNSILNGAFTRGFIFSANIGQFTSDAMSCNQTCGRAFERPTFEFAQFQTEPYRGNFRSYVLAGYLQDTWRFHPRWTINFGVRYEFFSVPEDRGDRAFNFDPSANGLVQQNRLGPVLDPNGNACGAVLGFPQGTVDAVAPAFGGVGVPGPWSCSSQGDGRLANSDRNNFAPRGGIAWDLFGNGKTVLRFGIGWYYDQQPINHFSQLLYNRPTSKGANPNALHGAVAFDTTGFCPAARSCAVGNSILNPAVQAVNTLQAARPNSAYSVSAHPFAVYARDLAHSNTPYTRQMSASVQQAVGNHLAVELAYIGTSAKQLPVVFNSNYQEEMQLFEFNTPPFLPNQRAGNFVFSPVYTMTNQAESSYHSMMVRVRAADWHGLRLHAAYNLSTSEDNASSGFFPTLPDTLNSFGLFYQRGLSSNAAILCLIGTSPASCANNPLVFPSLDFSAAAVTTTGAGRILTSRYQIPQDPFNFLFDELGRSDFHTKHRFVLDYTWDLPLWKESKWMGNWQVSGIFVAQSGQPFTIFAGPILGEVTMRADLLGEVSVSDNPNAALDHTNLRLPLIECINEITLLPGIVSPLLPELGRACTGTSRRNQFTGPNFTNFDLAIQKGFAIGEGKMLSFRAEIYNLSNRANFYNPISVLSTDGSVFRDPVTLDLVRFVNPDFGKIKSAHNPRQIQFGVRFNW